jgi:hypothetical protein
MQLDTRETAVVLCALRLWQKSGETHCHEHFDGERSPLSHADIDDLCERINTDAAPKKARKDEFRLYVVMEHCTFPLGSDIPSQAELDRASLCVFPDHDKAHVEMYRYSEQAASAHAEDCICSESEDAEAGRT